MERLERMPVPVLPAFVGAMTLSNVYYGMGFAAVRHITMAAAAVVLLLYIVKLVKFPAVFLKEYKNTVPCSLYSAFDMMLMILGSYYHGYFPLFGKIVWFLGLGIHLVHILVFTYRNVIRERKADTFLPSWFVTYNGIMVSCVVGSAMEAEELLQIIVYYGIIIYFILIPLLIFRLLKQKINDGVYHTLAVVLAPCSLCVVSYLNVIGQPKQGILYLLYGCVLASLLFIIMKLPKFFSYSFTPGFAGLTFPMAIGVAASQKMAGYLTVLGNEKLGNIIGQISGIQIYLTTMIIGYVFINFVIMAMKLERK